MKQLILILSLILVVQLGLALGLGLTGNTLDVKSGGPLLKLKTAEIDQVQIDGPTNQGSIVLKKVDDKWTLPDHFNAPADQAKVAHLLTTLTDLQRPWPVAKTADAEKRFKVADADFERRLVFKAGDKDQATLLLGSSPGFRKVHARVGGEQQVFDIPFSTYQASLKAVDWLDKKPLLVEADQISAIDLPDCRLNWNEGRPQLANLAENEQTKAEPARQLFEKLAGLNVLDIYAKAGQPLPNPVDLSIKLEMKDGKSRQYDFAKGDEADYAVLQTSNAPYLYKVSLTLLKELQETTRAKLVQAKPAASVPAADQKAAPTDNPQG